MHTTPRPRRATSTPSAPPTTTTGDTFSWSLEGDDAADFDIGSATGVLTFRQDANSGPLPDFENPGDDDSLNTYEVTVKATDDDSTPLSSSHAVTVTVTNVNETPEFTGTPSTAITHDENKPASDAVADYNARDEEGAVTWSLTGADRGDFDLSSDGVLTFKSAPNFEDAQDSGADNVYNIGVVATDVMSGTARLTASLDVTVTLNDLEEAGAVSVNNLNPGVGDELSFELSDPDGGLQAAALNTWVLQQRTPGSGSWQQVPGFGGDGVTGTLAVRRVQEEQTGKQLRVSITYEDRRGTGKTAASEPTAAVTADPIANAPPRFRPGGDFSIPEGEAGRDVGTPLVVSDRDNDTLRFGIEAR